MRSVLHAILAGVLMLSTTIHASADDPPATRPSKIIVKSENVPFHHELKFEDRDALVVVLPNAREVALWAEKDRVQFGEQRTKSGLQCVWGEQAYRLSDPDES